VFRRPAGTGCPACGPGRAGGLVRQATHRSARALGAIRRRCQPLPGSCGELPATRSRPVPSTRWQGSEADPWLDGPLAEQHTIAGMACAGDRPDHIQGVVVVNGGAAPTDLAHAVAFRGCLQQDVLTAIPARAARGRRAGDASCCPANGAWLRNLAADGGPHRGHHLAGEERHALELACTVRARAVHHGHQQATERTGALAEREQLLGHRLR
jgi:hypothetical protein